MELLKRPHGPSPTQFFTRDSPWVARQGAEQLGSQHETRREFPSGRLPGGLLIGPRGSWFGTQAVSQEGISSCAGPGARTAAGARAFLPPPILGVRLVVRAGPYTSLVPRKCWSVTGQVHG